MTRLFMESARLAFISILVLFLSGPVAVAQPPSDGTFTVCSSVPGQIGRVLAPEIATAEDIQAFHKAVNSLRTELNTVCRQDKTVFKLFKVKARKIVFEMSAGATEPVAYLNDSQLIVEFYGGPFDARSFRQMVKKALQGQKIPRGD